MNRARATAPIRGVVERLESRTLLAAAGPDGYGYVADATAFEEINFVEGAAGVASNIAVDLGSSTFNFYGTTYTGADQIFANRQGLISFGSHSNSFTPGRLVGGPFPRAIAPLWERSNFGVLTKLENTGGGAAPDRLIIQYSTSGPGGVRFQAILQLNTGATPGEITFNYVDIDTNAATTNGGAASVGIKDAGYESNRLLISLRNANNPLLGSGKAIRIRNAGTGQPRAVAGTITVDESPATGATLDASASIGSGLAYAWDFDTDGIYGETGTIHGNETGVRPTFTVDGGLNGPATYRVIVRVTDGNGVSSFDEGSLVVNNVLPTVTQASGPATGQVGIPVSYTVSGADAFPADVRGVSVSWDDEENPNEVTSNINTTQEPTFTFSHIFNNPGTYNLVFHSYQFDGNPSEPLNKTITITAGPDVQLSDGRLVVNGTSAADTITLDQIGGSARLNRNGTITTYPLASVSGLSLYAFEGDDLITCALAIPTLILGGLGNDTITTAGGADSINAGDGDDSVSSANGDDTVNNGAGDDSVSTGAGADRITLEAGNDTISAGAGNDAVSQGAVESGNCSIDGGGGFDSVFAGNGDNFIRVDGGTVSTGVGNDTIIGGLGGINMVIRSEAGDDSITTGAGRDTINCGSGNDTVSSATGNDNITCGGGAEAIIGTGQGNDTVFAGLVKEINTGDGDDQLTVFAGELLDAGDGNDVILAGIADGRFVATIIAGAGDDSLTVPRGAFIDCGPGNDFARAGSSNGAPGDTGITLLGGDGDDNLFTGDGADFIYGGAGRDTIHAGNGSDLLSGGGGHDKLFGQGGKDRLYGGDGNDRIEGQGGNDRLFGDDEGSDTLHGNGGDDLLVSRGDAFIDHLFGDGGADSSIADDHDLLTSIESIA